MCTPASRVRKANASRFPQVGENLIHEVVKRGGCAHFRRATETEFNLIGRAALKNIGSNEHCKLASS